MDGYADDWRWRSFCELWPTIAYSAQLVAAGADPFNLGQVAWNAMMVGTLLAYGEECERSAREIESVQRRSSAIIPPETDLGLCSSCRGRGWLHMADSMGSGPGVEACDDCELFDTDEDAVEAHAIECDCGLGMARDAEPLLCNACNGSGEGRYDGTTCSCCRGSGEERVRDADDVPEWAIDKLNNE
jgi:hypothetical protein